MKEYGGLRPGSSGNRRDLSRVRLKVTTCLPMATADLFPSSHSRLPPPLVWTHGWVDGVVGAKFEFAG